MNVKKYFTRTNDIRALKFTSAAIYHYHKYTNSFPHHQYILFQNPLYSHFSQLSSTPTFVYTFSTKAISSAFRFVSHTHACTYNRPFHHPPRQ